PCWAAGSERRSLHCKPLRRLRRRSRSHWSSGRSLILGTSEAEDRKENNSKKSETESEANSFPKTLCQVDAKNYSDDEIYERNEQQDNPPTRSADNLAPNVNIIDRDDRRPARLACLGEDFPASGDD